MVSNSMETDATAQLMFNHVGNGTFECKGLYGCANTTLTISADSGSVPISVPSRGTIVYEIPHLKWLGHETVSSSTIKEKSKSDAVIFPNPNNGTFTLELTNFENAIVSVYSISGVELLQLPVNACNTLPINLPNLVNGIYFIKVNDSDKQYVTKFIVNGR